MTYDPKTKTLTVFAVCYGDDFKEPADKPIDWFKQAETLDEAREIVTRRYGDPFPLHVEKWTFKRGEKFDKLLKREKVA